MKLDILGKTAAVKTVNGMMQISNRLTFIIGPMLPEMMGIHGMASAETRKRKIAGLPTNGFEGEETIVNPYDSVIFNEVSTDKKALAAVMKDCLKIIEEASSRNYGSVVYLDNKQVAATDGFRLKYKDLEVTGLGLDGICIPYMAAKIIAGILPTVDYIGIAEDRASLYMTSGEYRYYFQLSAVKYPNFRGILPKGSPHTQLSTEEVTAVVDACKSKIKAAKKHENITATFPGINLNARFLHKEVMGPADIYEELFVLHGVTTTILVALRMPEEKSA